MKENDKKWLDSVVDSLTIWIKKWPIPSDTYQFLTALQESTGPAILGTIRWPTFGPHFAAVTSETKK